MERYVAQKQEPRATVFPFDVDGFRGQMRVDVFRRTGENPPKGGRRQKDHYWPGVHHCTVYTPKKTAKADEAAERRRAKATKRLKKGTVDEAGPSGAGRKRK